MKKVLCIFLALTMVLLLAACATSSEGSSSGQATVLPLTILRQRFTPVTGAFQHSTIWAWDEARAYRLHGSKQIGVSGYFCDYLNINKRNSKNTGDNCFWYESLGSVLGGWRKQRENSRI